MASPWAEAPEKGAVHTYIHTFIKYVTSTYKRVQAARRQRSALMIGLTLTCCLGMSSRFSFLPCVRSVKEQPGAGKVTFTSTADANMAVKQLSGWLLVARGIKP